MMKEYVTTTSPAVTVLMSVFNGEEYLRKAIESILGQTFSDFEFLIINDGSTDDTGSILEHEAKRDARIKFFEQDNQGLVASLNFGLSNARGQLIARIDADDIAYPLRLEKQVAYMNDHPELLALGSAITLIDEKGRTVKEINYPTGTNKVKSAMMLGSKLAHPTVMMRREQVIQAGAYREACRHAEDYDLWLRLLEIGKIDNLDEPLLYYREHDKKISVTESFAQRLATECAKFAYQMRKDGKTDPLDSVELPLSIDKLKDFDISDIQLRELYVDTFIKLVKQKRVFTITEMNSVDYLAKWIIGQPGLFLRFKILKALYRYTRKRLAFSQVS